MLHKAVFKYKQGQENFYGILYLNKIEKERRGIKQYMEDKIILLTLFKNNILRINLQGYEDCICTTDAACNLLDTCYKYFYEKTKSLNMTMEDLDAIFKAEYTQGSEELLLWEDVKTTNISDVPTVEAAVVKRIKLQLKDYFLLKHLMKIVMIGQN